MLVLWRCVPQLLQNSVEVILSGKSSIKRFVEKGLDDFKIGMVKAKNLRKFREKTQFIEELIFNLKTVLLNNVIQFSIEIA